MSIKVSCPSCGKTLAAPDSAAGKRAKCPGCGELFTVPAAIQEAESLSVAPAAATGEPASYGLAEPIPAATSAAPAVAGEQRRPCPECGEMIVASAAKCRFCGAIFDPALKSSLAARGGNNEGLSTNGYIVYTLVFLFIPCACVLISSGLYYYYRASKPKMANQINTLGFVVFAVQILLAVILSAARR